MNFIKKYLKDNKLNIDLNLIDPKDLKYNKKIKYLFIEVNFEDNTYKSIIYAYDFCINNLCIVQFLPPRKI